MAAPPISENGSASPPAARASPTPISSNACALRHRSTTPTSNRTFSRRSTITSTNLFHLLDKDGEPVFSGNSGAKTNANGHFRFDRLAEGDYVVVAEPVEVALKKRLSASARSVRAFPEGEVRIELTTGFNTRIFPGGTGGPFQFRIEDANGIPLHDDHRTGSRRHGSGFDYLLPPGEYTLVTVCPSFEIHEQIFRSRPELALRYDLTPEKR